MIEVLHKVTIKPNWRTKSDEAAREEALEAIRRELIEAMKGHANDDATFHLTLSIVRPVYATDTPPS